MTGLVDVARRAAFRALPGESRYAALGVARSLVYRGTNVECPCCRGMFRAFRPHRARRGAKCPACGSLERHRVLWLYLEQRTNLMTAPLDVLHIAPEYSFRRRLRSQAHLDYLTADLDSPLADIQLDVTRMPFSDGSFDVVLCNHVLEHVSDDRAAMREIERILRPDGWAILLVPIERSRATTFEDPAIDSPEQRFEYYGQEDHARLYGLDYADRLAEAGFHVSVDDFGSELSEADIRRYGLRRDGAIEEIYHCAKTTPRTADRGAAAAV